MGLFDLPASRLLPGCKPACWRGLTFHIPDASTEVGRRIIVTYFPGRDDPAIEDMGAAFGPIRVRGLIVGDDYIRQALALQAAFLSPGPGTFLHPWLGEITAIVPPGAASISFTATELRVVRFEATFQPIPASGAYGGLAAVPLVSTLSRLLGAASTLLWAVRGFGSVGLAGGAIGASSWAAACEAATASAGALATLCDDLPTAPAFSPVLAPALATLEDAVALGAGADAATAITTALVNMAAPLAEAAIGAPLAAIGPGPAARGGVPSDVRTGFTVSGESDDATVLVIGARVALDPDAALRAPAADARAGTSVLLTAAARVAEVAAIGAPAEVARLTARIALLAHAVRTATEIAYESRQDATAWRDALDGALIAAADDVAALVSGRQILAGAAAPPWRALGALRSALAQDLNEAIGRLPSVRTYAPAATISAWLLAQHFAGDAPAAVVPMLDDIVRRNRLRHPALVSGTVEVLTR